MTSKHNIPLDDGSGWSNQDEQEHPQSILEWWCMICFFNTQHNGQTEQWTAKLTLCEWREQNQTRLGSTLSAVLHNMTADKHYTLIKRNDETTLNSKPGDLDIDYQQIAGIKGKHPHFKIYLTDKQNNLSFNFTLSAVSKPYFVAKKITDGHLPLGVGVYRYGFNPNLDLNGTFTYKNHTHTITKAKAYYEHVWGDFNYANPLEDLSSIKNNLKISMKLLSWFNAHHHIHIPNKIKLTSENSPLGYDWAWAVFDNNWSFFYGNILLFLMQGPVPGTFILNKDGAYTEYADVCFSYNHTTTAHTFDFIYPDDFSITAKDAKGILKLHFKMTHTTREFVSRLNPKGYWIGFVICEAPGTVTGTYTKNDGTIIKLNGQTKIEPQRQISILGHNQLELSIAKPPHGVGIDIELISHFFSKHLKAKLHLLPRPKLKLSIQKLSYNPKKNTHNTTQDHL